MRRLRICGRFRIKSIVVGCVVFLCFIILWIGQLNPILIFRDFGYLTRPIWDSSNLNQPKIVIPHFHADTVPFEELCSLHGWSLRLTQKPKVIDAIIFSIELDILEIRIKELWEVVDIFLVVEADRTFTGKSKPLLLKENIESFNWASEKLIHITLENVLSENPKNEFENEANMRGRMTSEVHSLKVNNGDLIIVGDADEIPFAETIKLLKSCDGFPSELHLQMQNYLYSFEFYVDTTNWKPHVSIYDRKTFFYHHHKRSSNHQLADAGWHCSFCFRYISDFIFKMTSYSHNDRVTSQKLLKKENIQRKICDGANIFDMLPEAYTFKELFAAMGNIPKKLSTFGIPKVIVENSEKFKFLLPGGCIREDSKGTPQSEIQSTGVYFDTV